MIWIKLGFPLPEQEQLSARLQGGKGENSIYAQGSDGWSDPLQSSHLTCWFGNHQPNFARKALEKHRRGGGCHACVENQGICSQRLDDAGFSILVICNHLVLFRQEGFFSSNLRNGMKKDEMRSRGEFCISLIMTFFQVFLGGFFFSAPPGRKLNFYFKREKLGFSYVPMIPDAGTFN